MLLRFTLLALWLAAALCTTTTPVGTPSTTPSPSATATASVSYLPGIISTIAGNGVFGFGGDGGAGTSAQLNNPNGLAVDTAGNVYIADVYNNRIRKVAASTGIITTIAGNGVQGFSGDGNAGTNAQFNNPTGVAVDTAGNVYIADQANQRVRKVTASTGIITTIAGNGVIGFSGDGSAGTGAQLASPLGVAVDAAGNVYIADTGFNHIRKVAANTGIITTIVGGSNGGSGTQLSFPRSVAVDAAGNVYIVDIGNNRVCLWTASTGIITTIAGNGVQGFSGDGNAGTNAQLSSPTGVAVDTAGNVYIADAGNNRIRKVITSTGIITTIAGNIQGFSGDGYAGTSAQLNNPFGVAVDTAGNVYIADTANNRVRMLSAAFISPTLTPTSSPTPSPSPYCWPSLYRALPRMDLVGTLVGSALFPGAFVLTADENGCRQACCDAPGCDSYTFAATTLPSSATGTASCFLYVNVTALVPSSMVNSGALLSVYS